MPRGFSSVLSDPVPLRFLFPCLFFFLFPVDIRILADPSVVRLISVPVSVFAFFFVLCVDQDTPSVFYCATISFDVSSLLASDP